VDLDNTFEEEFKDPAKEWKNSVLVIIPTRLGLSKVNKEYYSSILYYFQCKLNAGAIGGRPS
jgi:hypothetical protein